MVRPQNEGLSALYIIQKGRVKITFGAELFSNPNVCSLKTENEKEDDNPQNSTQLTLDKTEGSYFGEWTLLGEQMGSLSAMAMDDVVCAILTKEKFDLVVGPITKLSQDDYKYVIY